MVWCFYQTRSSGLRSSGAAGGSGSIWAGGSAHIHLLHPEAWPANVGLVKKTKMVPRKATVLGRLHFSPMGSPLGTGFQLSWGWEGFIAPSE